MNATNIDKCIPLALLYTYDDHNKLLAAKLNGMTSRNVSTTNIITPTDQSMLRHKNKTVMS
jgi:hypothetical protein